MSKVRTKLVDTNVILRYLVGDNKSQQLRARDWFLAAEAGEFELVIAPLVVAEACFVLESFYKLDRAEIARAFEVFLSQKWLQVQNREVLLGLWSRYMKGLHFVDSYLLSYADNEKYGILSFDKELN